MTGDDISNWLMIIVALTVAFSIYFLPAFIAWEHRHRHRQAVFVVNLFLGWTFLGWVLALAWACMDQRERPARRAQ